MENNHQFDIGELETLANHAFSHRFNHTLHAYIDIAEDLVAGTLLSQIIFWFTPDQYGKRKVKIFKDGHYWLAKKQEDWYKEIRITAKQYRTAIEKLEKKKLVIKTVYKFDGKPTTHIRLNYPVLREEIKKWKRAVMQEMINGENPFLTKGKKPEIPSVFDDAEQQLGYLEQGEALEPQGESPNPLGDMVFYQMSNSKLTKGQKENLPLGNFFNRDYDRDYDSSSVVNHPAEFDKLNQAWQRCFKQEIDKAAFITLTKYADVDFLVDVVDKIKKHHKKRIDSPFGFVFSCIEKGGYIVEQSIEPKEKPAKQGQRRADKKEKLPETLRIQMEMEQQEQPQQPEESVDPEERQKLIQEKIRLMKQKFESQQKEKQPERV